MSESERNGDDHTSDRSPHRRPRLMDRAMRERWASPGSLRRPLVERLGEIPRDPVAPHRDVASAVSAILTASKINLANIALTMKVQTHEEVEERVTEIERRAGLGGQIGWATSGTKRDAPRRDQSSMRVASRCESFCSSVRGPELRCAFRRLAWSLASETTMGTPWQFSVFSFQLAERT